MRRISNFDNKFLSQFVIDVGGFISFGLPHFWNVFELVHYGLDDLMIVQTSYYEPISRSKYLEIFSQYKMHFSYLDKKKTDWANE